MHVFDAGNNQAIATGDGGRTAVATRSTVRVTLGCPLKELRSEWKGTGKMVAGYSSRNRTRSVQQG